MDSRAVNEKRTFWLADDKLAFYMECLHVKMEKKAPISIYHYHENIEFLFCASGNVGVKLPNEIITLNPGDFIYFKPNTPHSTFANSDSNEHICIKFLPSVIHVPSSRKIPPVGYFISLTPDYCVLRAEPDSKDRIRDLFFSSSQNYSHTDYFKRLIFRANIMELMAYVFRKSVMVPKEKAGEMIPDVFLNVLDYVDKNYATVTLEEAANFCSLSYSYFSRTFKEVFNISFSNYVIKKRIEKSLSLISNSDLSLNDVSLECGFSNLSHFIKCFNQEKGITPKKFRKIVVKK